MPQDLSAVQAGDNVWEMAQRQLDEVAKLIGLNESIHGYLRVPKRVLEVSVPVRMDDGSFRMFVGYRVQHNMSRGPGKGGIRYPPGRDPRRGQGAGDVDDLEVRAGQHSVRRRQGRRDLRSQAHVDAGAGESHPPVHQRNIDHHRTRERYSGARRYTTPQIMAWIMDTFSMQAGYSIPGVVTGKPISIGGSLGRDKATGSRLFVRRRRSDARNRTRNS